MEILKKECISLSVKDYNEDTAYVGENFAWVIDGATGLNGRNFIDEKSDARWFVKKWNDFLIENIMEKDVELEDMVREGIGLIKDEYFSNIGPEYKDDLEPIDFPSSTIAIIRFMDNILEYFVLGDCMIVIGKEDGTNSIIVDESLNRLDGRVIDFMTNEKLNNNLTHAAAREKAMDLLIKHRLMKNKPGGYWSLEFSEEAAKNALKGKEILHGKNKILMMSDGFSVLFNKYLHLDEKEIIEFVEIKGLDRSYSIIREIENNDSECIEYPRLKKSDDSSAVFLELI